MPKLDIDMFDETPKVGDKVKVMGKVDSIDEDTGEVDISYDDVSIINKKKRKNSDNNNDDETVYARDEMMAPPESQSLDNALAQAFPRTQ